VRIDVLYGRLSKRGQAALDVIMNILLMFPLMGALTYAAGSWMVRSWVEGERWFWSIWYPPLGPVRTMVFLGLVLFTLQVLAVFVRDVYLLVRGGEP
jgi:TRAP-type mannitol/chloroaromatic compound transport system permease small subunit